MNGYQTRYGYGIPPEINANRFRDGQGTVLEKTFYDLNHITAISITTEQLIAGSALISAALIETLNASQITVGTLTAGIIYAGDINASQISAGTINASIIYAGDINASQISAGTLTLLSGMSIINNGQMEINSTSITIYDASGDNIVLDKYGINPTFSQWFSNIWANSEQIWYDATTYLPEFVSGSGVTSNDDATFKAPRSIKITTSNTYYYTPSTSYGNSYQNPQWFANLGATGRISFWTKGGQARLKLLNYTSSAYIDLTDSSGNVSTIVDFSAISNWQSEPFACSYDASSYTDVRPEITNIGTSNLYINAPQNTYDKTGKWSQLYVPGKYAYGTVNGRAIESMTIQSIYVQTTVPTDTIAKDVRIDTDDYSRYDKKAIIGTTTLSASDNEFITASGTFTITLHVGTTPGITKYIYNIGTGLITLSGTINGTSNLLLYPNDSVKLMTDGANWRY